MIYYTRWSIQYTNTHANSDHLHINDIAYCRIHKALQIYELDTPNLCSEWPKSSKNKIFSQIFLTWFIMVLFVFSDIYFTCMKSFFSPNTWICTSSGMKLHGFLCTKCCNFYSRFRPSFRDLLHGEFICNQL